ncbi:MAG: DNA primase [Planctomycetes bacterium]|nr:DNA primase [Planctomycetota bacterium]
MAGHIPEHVLAQVQSAVDIVGLISQYVPLKKAGRNYKGLCPFHKEKTPSFTVNPDRQMFHCFGCKEGGTAFKFLMLQEHLSFPEAVRHLAQGTGITIPDEPGHGPEERGEREAIYGALGQAALYFASQVRSEAGVRAWEYLQGRRISPTTIELWQLGYSLKGWDNLLRALEARGISRATLEKAGLITQGAEGRSQYDRFRNRVMFPIVDVRNRVIGFGARILDEGENGPKYLNSPETPVFNKSACLYGLNRAKVAISEKGVAIVVEGYTDVLAAHQLGVCHVVATLGTALTRQHLDLLRRYARRVVLVYDADAAGEKASDRSLELFLEEDVDVSLATLSAGQDPCDFLLANGVRAFEERIEQACEILAFKLQVVRSRYNFDLMDDKSRATDEILALAAHIANPVKRDLFLQAASGALRVSESTLRARALSLARRPNRPVSPESPEETRKNVTAAEIAQQDVLTFLLHSAGTPETAESVFQQVSVQEFSDDTYRTIYQTLRDIHESEGRLDAGQVMRALETRGQADAGAARIVAEMLEVQADETLPRRLEGSLKWFSQKRIERKVMDLKEELKQAQARGDSHRLDELLRQVQSCLSVPAARP